MERLYSAASKRASNGPKDNSEWYCEFSYTNVKGLGYEEGIHRRDPSSILNVNDTYYVWYTKSFGKGFFKNVRDPYTKKYPWDYADIWYATSSDGINWDEKGIAVSRGKKGSFDGRTVCTPDVMQHDGKYYLVYQAKEDNGKEYLGYQETIGMSIADSPDGPWRKVDHPILERMEDGHWFDEKDNYNDGQFHGVVHDPLLLFYNDKYYLYYKCGSTDLATPIRYAGRDTRWGVAISDNPEGPYKHSPWNPITNSGHETQLWKYNGGICALINRDGPEKGTIQYAKDGINFEIMSHVLNSPFASGAYRCEDTDQSPLAGIRWGLSHRGEGFSEWNYIERFDTLF